MEPIERELRDRKERLKALVIELQRLEAIRPFGSDPMKWDEHDRKIVELRYLIGNAPCGIAELEEIIAQGPSPPRIRKPDTTRRRELSDAERNAIAAKSRADILKDHPQSDDLDIRIHVERFTDLEGHPQIGIYTRIRRPDKPSDPSSGS